jgi:CHAD domain-containing protein
MLLRLDDLQVPLAAGELDDVRRGLTERRAAAQQPLVAIAKSNPPKKMDDKITRLVCRIRWRGRGPEPTARQAGQLQMLEVTKEFCAAANAAGADQSMEVLHGLRIAGKKLRYTIELFASVANDSLRQSVYPIVEELQERLGAINDHAAAGRYLRDCRVAVPALEVAFSRLADCEDHAVGQAIDAFCRWFNPHTRQGIEDGSLTAFRPPPAA